LGVWVILKFIFSISILVIGQFILIIMTFSNIAVQLEEGLTGHLSLNFLLC
jgi:hypothetical protein